MKYTMRNTLLIMLLLFSLPFTIGSVLAQDDLQPTPTVEVVLTAESQPAAVETTVSEAPTIVIENPASPSSDTMMTLTVFGLLGALVVVTLGSGFVINSMTRQLGDSVKTEQLQEFVNSLQKWLYQKSVEYTANTPQKWDDGLPGAFAGLAGYNPNVSAYPPRPNPVPVDKPVVAPPDLVVQPLGKVLNPLDYDLRKKTFTEIPLDEPNQKHRRIAVPTGYGYFAETGDSGAHTDAFFDPDQGFKMNLDSRGRKTDTGNPAQFGYETLDTYYFAAGQRYTLGAIFDAKLSGGAVNIRAVLLQGNAVAKELPPQRIEPGTYDDKSVVWVFESASDRFLRLRVFVETEYASLHSESYVRWKMFPLERQESDYGQDAVVRF